MKISITDLATSLFWHYPSALNEDTGEIYDIDPDTGELIGISQELCGMNEAKLSQTIQALNIRKLPLFSPAPIYQRYLVRAREQLGIKFGSWLEKAPVFEFVADCEFQEEKEFAKEAHSAVYSFSDPSMPYFADYLNECRIEFAKEWCKKEGYEWCEE